MYRRLDDHGPATLIRHLEVECCSQPQAEVPHRLPIDSYLTSEIDVGPNAETAPVERGVPFHFLTDAVPADSDERIPDPGVRARRGNSASAMSYSRKGGDATGHGQVGRDPASETGMSVDQIQIGPEDRPLWPISPNATQMK